MFPLLQGCPAKFNINGVELSSRELCNHDTSCLPGNRAPIGFEYEDFYFGGHAYRPELNLSSLNNIKSEIPGTEQNDKKNVIYSLDEIKKAASSVLGKITTDNTGGIPRVCDTYNGPIELSWSTLNDPFTIDDYSVYNINHINFKKTVKNIIDMDAQLNAQLKKIEIEFGLDPTQKNELEAAAKAGIDRTNDIEIGFNASYIEVGLSQEVIEKMFYGQDRKYKVCLDMITGQTLEPDNISCVGQADNNSNKNGIKLISGVGLVWVTSMNVTNDTIKNAFAELKAKAKANDTVGTASAELMTEISNSISTNINNSFVDGYKIVSINRYSYKEKKSGVSLPNYNYY
jgi:hypothetical protein